MTRRKNTQAVTGRRRSQNAADIIGAEVEGLRRLGFGPFTHPEIERWIARVLLFYHMRKKCNADLIKLRDSCLPGCDALFDFGRQQLPHVKPADFPHVAIETRTPTTIRSELVYIDSWAKLRAAAHHSVAQHWMLSLESWTVPRNLRVDWFLDALIRILCGWRASPEGARTLQFGLPGSLPHNPHKRFGSVRDELRQRVDQLVASGPPPAIPAYNPAAQTREEHLSSIRELLEAHHSAQENRFMAAGFHPTVLKRARSGETWEHMNWFIAYQIHNKTAAKIAESTRGDSIDESGINQAIRKLAQILDVPLRSRTSRPVP